MKKQPIIKVFGNHVSTETQREAGYKRLKVKPVEEDGER